MLMTELIEIHAEIKIVNMSDSLCYIESTYIRHCFSMEQSRPGTLFSFIRQMINGVPEYSARYIAAVANKESLHDIPVLFTGFADHTAGMNLEILN